MKLHLPKLLRNAVLACMVSLTGISASSSGADVISVNFGSSNDHAIQPGDTEEINGSTGNRWNNIIGDTKAAVNGVHTLKSQLTDNAASLVLSTTANPWGPGDAGDTLTSQLHSGYLDCANHTPTQWKLDISADYMVADLYLYLSGDGGKYNPILINGESYIGGTNQKGDAAWGDRGDSQRGTISDNNRIIVTGVSGTGLHVENVVSTTNRSSLAGFQLVEGAVYKTSAPLAAGVTQADSLNWTLGNTTSTLSGIADGSRYLATAADSAGSTLNFATSTTLQGLQVTAGSMTLTADSGVELNIDLLMASKDATMNVGTTLASGSDLTLGGRGTIIITEDQMLKNLEISGNVQLADGVIIQLSGDFNVSDTALISAGAGAGVFGAAHEAGVQKVTGSGVTFTANKSWREDFVNDGVAVSADATAQVVFNGDGSITFSNTSTSDVTVTLSELTVGTTAGAQSIAAVEGTSVVGDFDGQLKLMNNQVFTVGKGVSLSYKQTADNTGGRAIVLGNGTLNIDGGSITAESLCLADGGSSRKSNLSITNGGYLEITSTDNENGKYGGICLSHWMYSTSNVLIEDGEFRALGAKVNVVNDAERVNLTIGSAGVMNTLGLRMHGAANVSVSGMLNLGTTGIENHSGTFTLDGGTLGALDAAGWTSQQKMSLAGDSKIYLAVYDVNSKTYSGSANIALKGDFETAEGSSLTLYGDGVLTLRAPMNDTAVHIAEGAGASVVLEANADMSKFSYTAGGTFTGYGDSTTDGYATQLGYRIFGAESTIAQIKKGEEVLNLQNGCVLSATEADKVFCVNTSVNLTDAYAAMADKTVVVAKDAILEITGEAEHAIGTLKNSGEVTIAADTTLEHLITGYDSMLTVADGASLTLGGKVTLDGAVSVAESIANAGALTFGNDLQLDLTGMEVTDGANGTSVITLLTGAGTSNLGSLTDAVLTEATKALGTNWVFNADGTISFKSSSLVTTITTRQTGSVDFSYYKGISFKDIFSSSASGGAIYGGNDSTISLSNNGSVVFEGNTASYYDGGAIYGGNDSTISLSNNGSVEFSGNTASYYGGGAIYGDSGSTITLSNNGSVSFSGNTASGSSSFGGAICGEENSTIKLSNNGSVEFSGNRASSYGGAIYGPSSSTITLSGNGSVSFSGNRASSYGGAICGYSSSTITLSDNGSVSFSENTASSSSFGAYGGAIYGYSSSTITLSGNESVSFSENTASGWYSYGGAIYGYDSSTITLSNNGSVEFSGNTASGDDDARGGAIYGDYITLSNNGSVEFSGNTASGDDDARGGAIYGDSITLSGNESVSFSGNTASSSSYYAYGGAIYGDDSSTITLSNNESVSFSQNKASGWYAYGGAIYGYSTITLSGNGSVSFSGNTASGSSYAYGGAINGDSITLSGNESVSFSENTASGGYAYGGAIYGYSAITLSGNGSVTFSGNTASRTGSYTNAYGGAICGCSSSTITLSDNGSVSFSGNTASTTGSYTNAYGGAIYGYSSSTITLSDNGSVSFSGNTASGSSSAYGGAIYGNDSCTITLSGNESVSFSGNTASGSSSAYGGAIYGYSSSTITLSGNESVSFSENTASGYNDAGGGTIYGSDSSTITLSDNGSVEFSGNTARSSSSAYGGAIRAGRHLSIQNNDSVLFEKNVEQSGSAYRLRSIYAGGSGDVISLSAAAGKSIEFRDSVYIASGSTFDLNADYTDDEGVVHKQAGDIIFTGQYAKEHLDAILEADEAGRVATAEEVRLSQTTEVQTLTNLYGGRLRVEDGAIYKGHGITAMEGSGATVRVKDAILNHAGYNLTFTNGSSLVLGGQSTISGYVKMQSGSSLSILDQSEITWQSGSSLQMTGNLSAEASILGQGSFIIDGSLSLLSMSATSLTADSLRVDRLSCGSLTLTDASASSRIDSSVTLSGAVDVAGSLSISGSLKAASLKAKSLSATDVTVDTLSAGVLTADSVAADSLNLTQADAVNAVTGAVNVTGDVMVAGSLSAGTLNGGAVEVNGALSATDVTVDTLSAGMLTAGSVSSDSLNLTQAGAANAVTGAVNVAGDITVAGSLSADTLNGAAISVNDALSADTITAAMLSAGSVEAGTLNLTQAGAANTVTGAVNVTGDVMVAGSLSAGTLNGGAVEVNGALSATDVMVDTLSAGMLTAGSVSSDSLNLTQAGAVNAVTGAVNVTGDIMVAGSLSAGTLNGAAISVNDALSADTITAATLNAGSVDAGTLNLTQAAAVNTVTGAVNVTGDVMVAGSLNAGSLNGAAVMVNDALSADTITAAMLSAGSVEAGTLNLTQAAAVNTVTGAVNVTGDITVAGSLSADTLNGAAVMVNDALSADTITAAMLNAGSVEAGALNLTQADAVNMVTGAVNVRGNISVAGSLDCGDLSGEVVTVAGNLSAGAVQTMSLQAAHVTAASLQTDSLQTASLTLTDAAAGNTIGSLVVLSGDALVAGSLTVAGRFSANNVSVDGDFSAVSLQAASLVSTGEVELTGSNVVHHITGDMEAASVSLATGATLDVGGVLTAAEVQMSGTAQTGVSAAAFGADTMNFVLDRAALESLNIVQGERATIACSDHALSDGFKAMLNGSATESVDAAAYTYAIATSGNMVQVEADYRWWDTQVWYRGAWVGESSWDDYLVAGYDAIDGVETIDLGGGSFSGFTMMVELEDGVDSVTFSNGSLDFEYIDMFAGQLNVGDNTTLNVTELYAEEGLTLGISGEKTSVTVSDYLEVGEVCLDYAKLYVTEAEIATLSGTTGCLTIADDGAVTIGSDVTLSSLINGGSLDVSGHKLVVNGLTEKGGNVTAGEVETRSNMRKAATFDCLIADKVTVTNSNGNSRYTDDLSVGDGSAIGELVAETLELRDGSMQLGRDDKATSQSLQKLKLAAGTSMELNENTALAVTGTLDAGVNTTVSMKQGASLSYGDVSISNKRSDATASVTARELAAGTGAVVTNAHAAFAAAAEKSVDYQFANSSVENAGSKLLTLTNRASTLSGLHATGGNVDVQALGDITLAELEIAAARTISAAAVTVTELVKLSDGAKLAGNLTLASGATVDLGDTLTLEGALNLQTGLTLSGTVLETIAGLAEGQSHILFSGVTELDVQEAMTLSNMRSIAARTQEAVSYRELMDGQQVSAADYFSNLSGNTGLVISYNKENGTVSISHTLAVPEPTTATLSLLALAALCARRRRK